MPFHVEFTRGVELATARTHPRLRQLDEHYSLAGCRERYGAHPNVWWLKIDDATAARLAAARVTAVDVHGGAV